MTGRIELLPYKHVLACGDHFISQSNEPWLRLSEQSLPQKSGFYRIEYGVHFLDDPVRPILRIVTDDETIDRVLPGPVAGKAMCQIYFPNKVRSISFNPTMRQGIFNFRLEELSPIAGVDILSDILMRRPRKLFSIFLALLFGYKKEAINAIDWVIGHQPVNIFKNWLEFRSFKEDDLFLSPREERNNEYKFLFLINIDGAYIQDTENTLTSIKKQNYKNYRVLIQKHNQLFSRDDSFGAVSTTDPLIEDQVDMLINELDYIFFIDSGSKLHELALDAISSNIAINPNAAVIYFDEIVTEDNRKIPEFKPDWSPVFYLSQNYIGKNLVISTKAIRNNKNDLNLSNLLKDPGILLNSCPPNDVIHIRRFLIEKPRKNADNYSLETSNKKGPFTGRKPVSIIIPTRDRKDLLKPCIDSILKSDFRDHDEIIIIDNQSKSRACLDYLEQLKGTQKNIRVIPYNKPFNYSKINNFAASEANANILIFLNNDTKIITHNWIELLSAYALQPQIGAVGACLLFENDLIQHSGIVIGMGQDAGHFESFQKLSDPSWLSRNSLTHEVSAVTGACLAVEKNKFMKMGGFDANNFPIEFSDLDLCLRLFSLGLQTLYVPEVQLMHKESASRGRATTRPLSVYKNERDNFQHRWRRFIRDDPFFHPALSLYSRHMALE